MLRFLVEELNNPKLNKRRNRHLDSLTTFVGDLLVKKGYTIQKERKIITKTYSKKCDLIFSTEERQYVLELKSISSSFGKNYNNRIEEMTGQAWLLSKACDGFGYVFVYHDINEEYTHYEKLKDVLHGLHCADLLKYCLLIKVSKNDFEIDKAYSLERLLETV